jgi:hypothetical protein
VIVDCATLSPAHMQGIDQRVASKGGKFLEAPVSGTTTQHDTLTKVQGLNATHSLTHSLTLLCLRVFYSRYVISLLRIALLTVKYNFNETCFFLV